MSISSLAPPCPLGEARLIIEARGSLMRRDEAADRFEQHVLLGTTQVNRKFLERNYGGIVRMIVATYMEFCDTAWFDFGRQLGDSHLRQRCRGWKPSANNSIG